MFFKIAKQKCNTPAEVITGRSMRIDCVRGRLKDLMNSGPFSVGVTKPTEIWNCLVLVLVVGNCASQGQFFQYYCNCRWLNEANESRQSHRRQSLVSQSFPSSEKPLCLPDMDDVVTKSTLWIFTCYASSPVMGPTFFFTHEETQKSKLCAVGLVSHFAAAFQLYLTMLQLYCDNVMTLCSYHYNCLCNFIPFWLYSSDFFVSEY